MLRAAKPQQSWNIRDLLGSIRSSRSVRPPDASSAEIIHMPNGVDRLLKNIRDVQKELLELQFERRDIDEAENAVNHEIYAYREQNRIATEAAAIRKRKLQEELIPIIQAHDIYAALPGVVMPDAPPLQTRDPEPTDLEWQDTEQ